MMRLWRSKFDSLDERRYSSRIKNTTLAGVEIVYPSSTGCVLHANEDIIRRKENGRPVEMQPATSITTTTTASRRTSTTLFADDGKVNFSEWFPIYQSCIEHFVNVAQHRPLIQSFAAHINILLPYQRTADKILNSSESTNQQLPFSLTRYIRRLVVTATDTPNIMQDLFGANWIQGVGTIHSQERINYLFAAKSSGWLQTKAQYDVLPYETVPYLRPLRDPQEEELRVAESLWSQWLAMEDWMVGSRSPFEEDSLGN
ncbi:hypothetical protein UA08_09153 [Talaromyces atroroseus]|uniref:Uncharacterized protein n=1 Tax=Talaromyces atroroseus TaxID=1441469 RepID=A0A1Q5Q6V3_TALAT|nr:hypothetical protein UA08_09153 [Talaromyces atroroseus]OKL55572.1 hypothetical protein UA08_09153 [Talaromyces atroroseus]